MMMVMIVVMAAALLLVVMISHNGVMSCHSGSNDSEVTLMMDLPILEPYCYSNGIRLAGGQRVE